jgi:hypothetical protein
MRRWEWCLDEIRVALVQGLSYKWIAQHIWAVRRMSA